MMNFNVTIIDSFDEVYEFSFRRHEYPNLMELIMDNTLEEIGDCLGRGLCGTCHVKQIDGELSNDIEFSELKILQPLFRYDSKSRLACQIMLDKHINNCTFKVQERD